MADDKKGYPTAPKELKEACDRYKIVLDSAGLNKFVRTGFFDVDKLKELIEENQSNHVKVYYAIDEVGDHFLFLAPTQADGRAREDVDTTVSLCCCTRPPCPNDLSDRYADAE